MGNNGLLAYNNRGVISACAAAEQHLSETDESEVQHSWCAKKHLLHIGADHHLSEAVIHSADNPEVAEKYKEFRAELEQISENPSVDKVRDFRNRFRDFVKDPSLQCSGVCALDKSDSTISTKSLSSGDSGGIYIVGGLLATALAVFLWVKVFKSPSA